MFSTYILIGFLTLFSSPPSVVNENFGKLNDCMDAGKLFITKYEENLPDNLNTEMGYVVCIEHDYYGFTRDKYTQTFVVYKKDIK